MSSRTETQRRRGNGSVGRTVDPTARASAEPLAGVAALRSAPSKAVTALTQRLNRLTQELAEARQRGEQLKAALEKHGRRVQQLIGERDRLTSLLTARDIELQRLNREIGALAARAELPQRGLPVLLRAVRSLLDRLRQARPIPQGARPAARRTQQADGAWLVPWTKHRPPKHVLAVVVFGLSEAEIERVLELVERYCSEHDSAPLLLTDNDAFQLFRNRRVVFEFLPPRSEQQRFAPELDWQLYMLRRLALIRRKWRPLQVVAFGRQAVEVVQLWRDSPFEETPLPAVPTRDSGLACRPAQQSVAA